MGCGSGRLMQTLHQYLPLALGRPVEIYGFEVKHHGARRRDWVENTVAHLRQTYPDVDWNEQLRCVTLEDPWPFAPMVFDVIVSSQVLEHVHNHDEFLKNHAERLSSSGYGIHIFPPKQTLLEQHVRIPFAHLLKQKPIAQSFFTLAYAIARCNPLATRTHARLNRYSDLQSAAQDAHQYLLDFENTPSLSSLAKSAERYGLTVNYRMTPFVIIETLRRLSRKHRSARPYNALILTLLRPFRYVASFSGSECLVVRHKQDVKSKCFRA